MFTRNKINWKKIYKEINEEKSYKKKGRKDTL